MTEDNVTSTKTKCDDIFSSITPGSIITESTFNTIRELFMEQSELITMQRDIVISLSKELWKMMGKCQKNYTEIQKKLSSYKYDEDLVKNGIYLVKNEHHINDISNDRVRKSVSHEIKEIRDNSLNFLPVDGKTEESKSPFIKNKFVNVKIRPQLPYIRTKHSKIIQDESIYTDRIEFKQKNKLINDDSMSSDRIEVKPRGITNINLRPSSHQKLTPVIPDLSGERQNQFRE